MRQQMQANNPDPVQGGSQALQQALSEAGLEDDRLYLAMTAVLRARESVVSELARALGVIGLSTSEFLVLSTLSTRRERGISLGQLADGVLLHPTTVTQLVDALEARGMVKRKSHPRDRRSILAVLTELGWEHTRGAIVEMGKVKFGLAGISLEGAELILRTLECLDRGLWSGQSRD